MHFCRICALELRNHKDLNFVAGSGEFRPIDAIVQLSFVIADTSQYVCRKARKCRGSLKSWVQARQKANKIEKELEEIYAKSASDKLLLSATVYQINMKNTSQ
jgi:hypothetical protein